MAPAMEPVTAGFAPVAASAMAPVEAKAPKRKVSGNSVQFAMPSSSSSSSAPVKAETLDEELARKQAELSAAIAGK